MTIFATAGHVDHGKSSLVLALTGTDPDRWAEEKARGLTIDLGFAHTRLPSGDLDLIDVPGHRRFLRNMLAGVGAVRGCLFVVAATEGWKPQSEEHLAILELLGITDAVVALTMADLVTPERLEAARMAVAERVAASALAGSEIIPVAAPTGVGVEAVRAALDRLLARRTTPVDHGRARLWVDRAFTVSGAGCVVTGTLATGALDAGDTVAVEPGGGRYRVRAIEIHGETVSSAGPGTRAALNLAGASPAELGRGRAVLAPGRWHLTDSFDATFTVLPAADRSVSRRGAFLLYLGTGEWSVRLRVLQAERLEPGTPGIVRLHLPEPVPLVPGDRFVLRDAGRMDTVGGGEVLDVAPVLPAAAARPDRSVDRVVRERGWVVADELERLTGEPTEPNVGPWVVDPAVVQAAAERLRARVVAAEPLGVDLAALDERDRILLDTSTVDGFTVQAGRVRLAGAADPLPAHPWVAALAAQPFDPPDSNGVDPAEVRALVRAGLVIERDGRHFHPEAVDRAASVVAGLLRAHPGGITVAQVRDALATTRRQALPLLAELDARRVTVRRDDVRVGGTALPAPTEPLP